MHVLLSLDVVSTLYTLSFSPSHEEQSSVPQHWTSRARNISGEEQLTQNVSAARTYTMVGKKHSAQLLPQAPIVAVKNAFWRREKQLKEITKLMFMLYVVRR